MKGAISKSDVIEQLQREIRSLQGYNSSSSGLILRTGIASLESAFPEKVFPTGVIHELISYSAEEKAATTGFLGGLLGCMMQQNGACLWISTRRTIFPPALKIFGIDPERIIFIDLPRQKEALWSIEEALKCKSLAGVVGELPELSFTESRRFQLAVEKSRVTGFIHRHKPKTENTTASVTRWKIMPLSSETPEGLPGLGFPRWQVQLAKVRNGTPGTWQIEWINNAFRQLEEESTSIATFPILKTG